MKYNTYRFLLGLLIVSAFTNCASSKKVVSTGANLQDSLPNLPVSEIDIPIKVHLPSLMARVESMVPQEFNSERWPEYTQSSCDFRYKYRFVRTPLKLSIVNNQAVIAFGGNYQIAGSRSICAFGQTAAPWISGSCGFGNEPLRKVNISMNSWVSYLPDYKIKTRTELSQLVPVDKCQVTLLNTDMTGQVMDSIKASIAAFAHTLDSSVAALDFSNTLKLVTAKSSRKIPMSKYGYLQVKPTNVRISTINQVRDTLMMTIGVSGYAELTSDSTELSNVSVFPVLQTGSTRQGISIYANSHFDYEFLSRLVTDTLHNKVFDLQGHTFVIRNLELRSALQRQLEIRIDFTGSKKGTFILFGTPVLDVEKQTISIPDINYDLKTKDIVLSVGERLFRNRIINSLKEKSVVDLPALIEKSRPQINAQLSRPINSRLISRGQLTDVKITGLVVGPKGLHLQTAIRANLELIANNFQ